jgi:hypothetical protein
MLITLPKRRPRRIRVLLHGHLETADGRVDVRIRDVSTDGLLIEMAEPCAIATEVAVVWETLRLEGSVVWQKGSWYGITLDKKLPAKTWDMFAKQSLRVSAPRGYRHDEIADDDVTIAVTPRRIRLPRLR